MQGAGRLYYFDFARALLMFLGVPYHIARIYGDGRDNLLKSPDSSLALHVFSEFTHSFRMEAFFIVAGFFSVYILLRKAPWEWVKNRFFRIVVPLVSCTFLLGPFMNYARLYQSNPDMSWAEYSAFASEYWLVVTHFWFLYVLWAYCCLCFGLAWMARKWPSIAARASDLLPSQWRLARLPFTGILLVLAVLIAGYLYVQPPKTPYIPMFFINKTYFFLPFFAFGALLALRPALLEPFLRFSIGNLVLALAFTTLFIWADLAYLQDRISEAASDNWRYLGAAGAGLFWGQLILSLGRLYLDRPNALIRYFCDAALCVYLFHLPIAWLLALPLLHVPYPPVLEVVALVIATTLLSVGAYEVIHRVPILAFLFNGTPLPKRPEPVS